MELVMDKRPMTDETNVINWLVGGLGTVLTGLTAHVVTSNKDLHRRVNGVNDKVERTNINLAQNYPTKLEMHQISEDFKTDLNGGLDRMSKHIQDHHKLIEGHLNRIEDRLNNGGQG